MIQILQVSIEQGRALIVDIGKFTIKRISIGLKRFYTFFLCRKYRTCSKGLAAAKMIKIKTIFMIW